MVKKIVTLLLFIVLIGLALLQFFFIRNSTETLSGLSEKAEKYAEDGDMEGAYGTMKVLEKQWLKQKNIFEALMEHSETDKISTSMEKAISFASQEEDVQFLAEVSVLKFLLEHIHEIDSLSLENIL